jgi:hypothetical protein
VIRAAVRRDGPAEWSWSLADDHGDLIVGIEETWNEALAAATRELAACRAPAPDVGRSAIAIGRELLEHTGRPPAPSWRRWLGL